MALKDFQDFYTLFEILNDDLEDVLIVLHAMMSRCDIVGRTTLIRNDLHNMTLEKLKNYDLYIDMALDLPLCDLKNIVDKKQRAGNIQQYKDKIKKLTQENKELKLLLSRKTKTQVKKSKAKTILVNTRQQKTLFSNG